MTDSRELAKLFASLFIARQDVKAIQAGTGAYYTHVADRNANPPVYLPWDMQSLVDHIEGRHTYGHYLLNQANECKVIAFDIDLVKQPRFLPVVPMPQYDAHALDVTNWEAGWTERNPREAWLNRADPARDLMKHGMRDMAHLIKRVLDDIEIPSTVTYTGAKGVHVYGFLGRGKPATYARQAIEAIVAYLNLSPLRGKNFYSWPEQHDTRSLFDIEVFPKQDHITEGDGFGNLMRLPLGRNLKSPDPTFFVDTEAPMGVLRPIDPLQELTRIEALVK